MINNEELEKNIKLIKANFDFFDFAVDVVILEDESSNGIETRRGTLLHAPAVPPPVWLISSKPN